MGQKRFLLSKCVKGQFKVAGRKWLTDDSVCCPMLLLSKSLVTCCRKLHHVSMCLKYGCKILGKHAVCDKGVKCCEGNMICDNTKILNYKVRLAFCYWFAANLDCREWLDYVDIRNKKGMIIVLLRETHIITADLLTKIQYNIVSWSLELKTF